MLKRLLASTAIACLLSSSALAEYSGPPQVQGANGYVVGNWYYPEGPLTALTGVAPGSGSIRCYPGYVRRTETTASFGLRLNILSGGGNAQAALYANSAANRPTGTALVSTASMSTTTAVFVSTAAVFQLQAYNIYWFCSNMDNATSAAISIGTGSIGYANLVGDASGNSLSNASAGTTSGVSTAQTFGTWPDLTSASWAVIAGVATLPIVYFSVGSIP